MVGDAKIIIPAALRHCWEQNPGAGAAVNSTKFLDRPKPLNGWFFHKSVLKFANVQARER